MAKQLPKTIKIAHRSNKQKNKREYTYIEKSKIHTVYMISKDVLGNKAYKLVITKPFIDKLSATYDFENDRIKKAVRSAFFNALKCSKTPLKDIESNKMVTYNYNYHLTYQSGSQDEQKILIQLAPFPKKKVAESNPDADKDFLSDKPFMRIEFNPDKLGKQGIQFLKNFLSEHTYAILDEKAFSKPEKITRLDVAIDLINVSLRDLITKSKDEKKYHIYFGHASGPETIYMLCKKQKNGKVKASKEVSYNKRQEIKDTGKEQLYNGLPHTRIEISIIKPKWDFNTLHKIVSSKSHLKNIDIYFNLFAEPPEANHHWNMFTASCTYLGIERTLATLPKQECELYRDTLQKCLNSKWDKENLWKSLEDVIKQYGFGDSGESQG